MKKTFRIVGILVLVLALVGAIVASMNVKPSNADKVWDVATTRGNLEAENYFVVYSDIMCPYCVAFENAIVEHEEEFEKYITENDILFEVRISDFLYEFGETQPINSRYSAEATFCAKKENKFWDYYSTAIKTIWNDYFKGSGKSAFAAMNSLDKSYWIKLGEQVGLGESFSDCVNNDETLNEVKSTATKMAKVSQGMPYFKFNNYATSGFDLSWGWDYVLMYFQAGLDS